MIYTAFNGVGFASNLVKDTIYKFGRNLGRQMRLAPLVPLALFTVGKILGTRTHT